MLTWLLVTGILAAELQPGSGDLTAPDTRVIDIPRAQLRTQVAAGAPLGVQIFAQDYDPSDSGEYAMNFGTAIDANETIVDIEYIGVSAAAAALGIAIDTTADHIPIITGDGKHIQYWPLVDQAQWSALSFDAAGVIAQVKVRVRTSKGRRWERTALHQVRQL
ncbi:hypothetical protein GCM10011380_00610 [Sphingomonas metalli]|uniref:Uncharacterized protein n=1 Tax=Sphingomonas metalli TaxID=1779358 RepID=A0A916SUV5_9SPHN|nr:hypothetical protein [Sphingomonas metalli]GGB15074.1 hypothetical protein GCM10011380_00610 [Sphingomonas metalli]